VQLRPAPTLNRNNRKALQEYATKQQFWHAKSYIGLLVSQKFHVNLSNYQLIVFNRKNNSMINYQSIIRRNPNKRFGKPCVRETRITVYDVLGWLAAGMTNEEILADFPELTIEDIQACLAYAADRERKLQYA
jgi:uncharacterized protein (DUF433 family)